LFLHQFENQFKKSILTGIKEIFYIRAKQSILFLRPGYLGTRPLQAEWEMCL